MIDLEKLFARNRLDWWSFLLQTSSLVKRRN